MMYTIPFIVVNGNKEWIIPHRVLRIENVETGVVEEIREWFAPHSVNLISILNETVTVDIKTSQVALDDIDRWFVNNPTIAEQREALGYNENMGNS